MATLKIETFKKDDLSGIVCDFYSMSRVYLLSNEELSIEPIEKTVEDLFFEDSEIDKIYHSEYTLKKFKFEYRIPGYFRYNESLGFDEESKKRLDKILNKLSEN